MSRTGLLRTVQFPDELSNRFQRNVSAALDILSSDDDILKIPVAVLVSAAAPTAIAPGKSVIIYRGAPGATLMLPSASAQGPSTGAIILLGNESAGAITVQSTGADTINGAGSISVASGALVVVLSDGVNTWLALAPGAAPLAWITALTGDVVAAGPGSVVATIQANVVTNAKLAQMAAGTIKGNNTGAPGNALDLTATQVTAMLNVFTSALKGLVPLSGGGTANFLRADGTFAVPPGLVSAGTLLRRSYLTSGTSLAVASGCAKAIAYIQGCGGGSGGTTATGSPGAGSGSYAEFVTTTILATWTYALGAVGTAGTSAPTDGGTGGNTTFSDGTTTVTVPGGGGAPADTIAGGAYVLAPGAGGAPPTNGTINIPGACGFPARGTNLVGAGNGRGADSKFGSGGAYLPTGLAATGTTGAGFGAGAGGAAGDGVTPTAGAAGAPALIILEEYS